ncbi:MAG: hypothetical protein JSU81_01355 [Candidatus Coatesbacteria bacterium]|nr:MAG: hypothetical protein JSU81_01355 [Candidatus Coatesbacteria bacterium]
MLKKYEQSGELSYSFETNADGFAVDEIHDTLWTYDWFYLRLRSAATSEVSGSVVYELDKVAAAAIDGTDGGIWLAGTSDTRPRNRIIKYSKTLREVSRIEVGNKPEHISVNMNNGDVWVSWPKNTAAGMRWFVSRYSAEGYHYGDIVCTSAVEGIVANERTGGCFGQFENRINEYAPSRERVGSWAAEGAITMAVDCKAGDLFVTANPFKREPYLLKIAGDSKRVAWRITLNGTDAALVAVSAR